MKIKIADIRRDGGTQLRVGTHEDTILEYVEAMREGATFPPVIVFKDATGLLWLADGFQRADATLRCGGDEIEAEVREGSLDDAILFAAGANDKHGLRRSRADKRKAALALLQSKTWQRRSDNWIYTTCGLSEGLLESVRTEAGLKKPTLVQASNGKLVPSSYGGREPHVQDLEEDEPVPFNISAEDACIKAGIEYSEPEPTPTPKPVPRPKTERSKEAVAALRTLWRKFKDERDILAAHMREMADKHIYQAEDK